jgi:PIN domain nuclease of toxin-antitoxin system
MNVSNVRSRYGCFLRDESDLRFTSTAADAWRLWVERNENGLYLSAVTIFEVRFGIEKCLAKGATKQAERLQRWLTAAETTHRARIIPVTIEIAHKAGELL